jgi:acetyltransferase
MNKQTASQLDSIFSPQSVAVVGASTEPNALGRQILENLVNYRFRGKLYPVNPKAREILGLRCFPSVEEIPDKIDLAVVVVPREHTVSVVEACGRKSVRGIVVITAGFRETGESGAQAEAKLAELAERFGFRLVGPNCMGVINTDPNVRLNATFAPTMPLEGNKAFLSQSGALGVAILNIADERTLGLSCFASLGNKAEVADDDVLSFWADDPRTKVILMYLESFSHPARFAQVARKVSQRKPILVVKSGKTHAGARAAISHTGALSEASDAALDAFLEHCGVIRVHTVEELFDIGTAFARNPLPAGPRVAVISNAGGPAILAVDSLIGNGLEMAELSEATLAAMRPRVPAHASIANPLDMLPTASADLYGFALQKVLEDPGVDMAMVIFVPPMMVDTMDVVGALERARRKVAKPVVGVLMAPEQSSAMLRESYPDHLALCQFPEQAAGALAALERHRRWRARGHGVELSFRMDRERIRKIFEGVRAEGRADLHLREALEVADACGIPLARYVVVRSAEEAENVGRGLGFPVVMKTSHAAVSHKTEARAVSLDVRSASQAFHTYHGLTHLLSLSQQVPATGRAVIVQETLSGRETVLGAVRDPHLGALLMFGLGGVFVEALRDVAFRPVPLTDLDAKDLIHAIRGYPVLAGMRGQRPVDFARLEDVILRLSQLVTEFEEIEELDINPFFVSDNSADCKAADCRIRIRANGD